MTPSLGVEERLSDALVRWVRASVRRPGLTCLAFALASGVALWHAANHLAIRGGTDPLFDPDLPFKQVAASYYAAFPILYENMFVVIDAETPESAGAAASALATQLRARPDLFRSVFLPGGGDFFEQHAFLYLETDELERLSDRLAEAQPYLAELARDGSLRGLAAMLARGARAVREGDVSGDRLHVIFDRVDEALVTSTAGQPRPVSWAEVLSPDIIEGDPRRRFLLMQPVLDLTSLQPAREAIEAVRNITRELGLDRDGVQVRITGEVALSYEELEGLRQQAGGAGLASLVLVAVILIAALRSWRLVVATLLTLVCGLILTVGFTSLAVGRFNMISVAFAVLFIGLGVDFGIHLCLRYREEVAARDTHDAALTAAVRSVGTSIALCAGTTAIGFFAFVPTAFTGVAELGLISGVGMFVSLFCTLTLLPALLTLFPLAAASARRRLDWKEVPLAALPIRHPRSVRAIAIGLGAVAIFLLPDARFDNNPLNVRDPSSESARTFADLLDRGTSSPWSVNLVAPDFESAELLAERLRGLDSVSRVVSVADFVPGEQQEKLEIIEDVMMFLTPLPGRDGQIPAPTVAERLAALRNLDNELRQLIAERDDDAIGVVAAALHASLGTYLDRVSRSDDVAAELDVLETAVIGSLPEQLRTLEAALSAGHVTLEKLPDVLLERMLTEDGRVRLQVFPHADLMDHRAMARFVDEVATIDPNVAGSASEIVESGRVIVTALRQALAGAAIAIALLLAVLWRRLDDTLLVLAPLCLAAALTVGAAVLLRIPFNFADVIVLPLLLGIGVDSGIHLVHRARTEGLDNLLQTTTARAVAYSALTTIASFGTLGFAAHRGLATLGQLLTLGVGFTILCNLVVLPALVVLHRPADAPRRASSYPVLPRNRP